MNHSGIASVKKVILISSFCVFTTFPLKKRYLFTVQQWKSYFFLLGVAFSPNQYDAFTILTHFSPYLRDAFFNCSCLQMEWQEMFALQGHTAHLGPLYPSPVLREPTAMWVGWEALISAWTAHLGECTVCWSWLSSVSLQKNCLNLTFVAQAAQPYLQPFCSSFCSQQMCCQHSPVLHTCIRWLTIKNLNWVAPQHLLFTSIYQDSLCL